MIKAGTFMVKGTYYYDAKAAMDSGALKPGASVSLKCDTANRHDPDAVAVYLSATNQQLGHISRQHCARVGRLISGNKLRAARVAKARNTNPMELEILVEYEASDAPARQAAPAPAPNDLIAASSKSLPEKPGVYKLTCKATGRIYVGSSTLLRTRAHAHTRELRAGGHANSALQSDFRTYGGDHFAFSLVCEARDARQAELLEARCIQDAMAVGRTLFYNATTDGKGISGAAAVSVAPANPRPIDRSAHPVRATPQAAGHAAGGGRLGEPAQPSPAPGCSASATMIVRPRKGDALTANQKIALLVFVLAIVAAVLLS